jgi:hypothetical protein
VRECPPNEEPKFPSRPHVAADGPHTIVLADDCFNQAITRFERQSGILSVKEISQQAVRPSKVVRAAMGETNGMRNQG